MALAVVRELLPFRAMLACNFGTSHGNGDLRLIDVLIVMLAGFFNPMVRSQRLLEALSTQGWMTESTGIERIPKSTLSDGLARFDPKQLKPLIEQLARQIPMLAKRDPDLARITRQVVAADGSFFQTLGDVAWAMMANGKRNQVRLNMQLIVDNFVPLDLDISGRDDQSEPNAFIRNLRPGCVYLFDRNFYSYALINSVLEVDSNFVLRLRKNTRFDVTGAMPLTPKDAEAGVLSDDVGHFHGADSKSNKDYRSFTDAPPEQLLRRVVVWDETNKKEIVLVTDLLDVPAYVIAALYRHRWQVELFFKWLKTYANFDHLISHHQNGILLQFYVATIATLLMHLWTGRRVSKYTLFWLGSIANGTGTFEQMQADLARREREKELERIRKRKAAARKKIGI